MENVPVVNTVLFSDVHLGSPTSRAYDLLQALKSLRFKKLIIVGDMFDDLNFEFLRSTHWELLEHIGKLSRRNVPVVWIEGNHDEKFRRFMAYLIGIPVYDEYRWEIAGKKFLALHGHQFDSFIARQYLLGRVLAFLYTRFQRIVSSHVFDMALMKISNRWLRLADQVAVQAVEHAKRRQVDGVICGHTHFADERHVDGISYYNLGCWNNRPSHLLVIDDDGTASFKIIE